MVRLWCGGVLVFAGRPCLLRLPAPTLKGYPTTWKVPARSSLPRQAPMGMMLLKTLTTKRSARSRHQGTWAVIIPACPPSFPRWVWRHRPLRRPPQLRDQTQTTIPEPIMARVIRRLRWDVGCPARGEAVLGGKWFAAAVDGSHCQSKLK